MENSDKPTVHFMVRHPGESRSDFELRVGLDEDWKKAFEGIWAKAHTRMQEEEIGYGPWEPRE
jgi:hypothetical protein